MSEKDLETHVVGRSYDSTSQLTEKGLKGKKQTADRESRLSRSDAAAGAPAESVCGEEDPGAGLEFLVKEMNNPDKPPIHNGDKHDK